MKKFIVIAVLCVLSKLYAEDSFEVGAPEVYADISEEAQKDSIKFDGARVLAGVSYYKSKINTGLVGIRESADHNLKFLGLTAGGEYVKTFKKKFVLLGGINVILEEKGKDDGSWETINPAYNMLMGNAPGTRYAKIETPAFVPSVYVKAGYQLKNKLTMIFLKAGAAMEKVRCLYKLNGEEIGSGEIVCYTPMVGLGAEHKFNKKWGITADVNVSIARKSKKEINGIQHQIRVRRVGVGIMGVYSLKLSL